MESLRDLSRCNSQSDLKEKIPPHTGSAAPSFELLCSSVPPLLGPLLRHLPSLHIIFVCPFPRSRVLLVRPLPPLLLLLVPLLPFFLLLPLFLRIAAHDPPERQRCKKCLEDTSPGNCNPGLSRNCMLDSLCRTDRVGHVYSLSAEGMKYKQGRTLSTYTRSHQSLFPSPIQVLGKGAASRRQPRRTGYYQWYKYINRWDDPRLYCRVKCEQAFNSL